MKKVKMFLPIMIVILGGLIMVTAGINNYPGTGILHSMAEMRWWGFIGLVMMIIGVVFPFIKIR